jgi:serine/threonine-protein kinase
LEEVLGVGGMSVVWKATDDVLRRSVAVKILAGDFTFDLARAAVLAEAQAVAQLSHPNVCPVFDYGESLQPDGIMVPYVVMELLTGPSLAQRLKEGPVAPKEALEIAAQIAAGLSAAHTLGVVHRDVKPANVILTSSGAKVIDFGIAATAGAAEVGPDGSILGTLSYVAPERLLGRAVLPPADMFSFGVLLFNLLTGKPPWPPWSTFGDRLFAAAPLPVIPGIPDKIGELYLSCIAEDPDERPTAAAAAAVLMVALTVRTPQPSDVVPLGGVPEDSSESVSLAAIADTDRRRRRRRMLVLAAGLAAVLAATAFAFSSNTGSGAGVSGSGPPTGRSALPTQTLPGDVPVVATPGPEVPVQGAPAPAATVAVTGVNPADGGSAMSFRTKGGAVVAVCDAFGPRVTSVIAEPAFYPNEVSLVLAALVFFTRPADGANPTITYRLTITCSGRGGVPRVTVASYLGDQLVTPSPTTVATNATASPSA